VDEGQTVAASYSTPNLFTIAQDLSKLKVQAAIDEADIGQVQVGQKALFTVDSYPDRQFRGQVTEVQLNPVTNNNVVTYNVIMQVDNEPRVLDASIESRTGRHRNGQEVSNPGAPPERKALIPAQSAATVETATARYIPKGSQIYKGELALFPGMTANVTIVTKQQSDVLRVPNAALRFNPSAFQKNGNTSSASKPAGSATSANKGGMVVKREDHVWVLENGAPKPLPVKIGVSDGQFTEVSGEGIQEGLKVLVGVDNSTKKEDTTAAKPVLGTPGPPGGGRH
jgi:HlyD family secretion protein